MYALLTKRAKCIGLRNRAAHIISAAEIIFGHGEFGAGIKIRNRLLELGQNFQTTAIGKAVAALRDPAWFDVAAVPQTA